MCLTLPLSCVKGVNYVYNTVDADSNFENVQKAVLPFGAIANITVGKTNIDVGKLFVSPPPFPFALHSPLYGFTFPLY